MLQCCNAAFLAVRRSSLAGASPLCLTESVKTLPAREEIEPEVAEGVELRL